MDRLDEGYMEACKVRAQLTLDGRGSEYGHQANARAVLYLLNRVEELQNTNERLESLAQHLARQFEAETQENRRLLKKVEELERENAELQEVARLSHEYRNRVEKLERENELIQAQRQQLLKENQEMNGTLSALKTERNNKSFWARY
jgi:chromosome segregation ATPase